MNGAKRLEIAFVCPFCGRDANAVDDADRPYVVHVKPTCARFDALGPAEYMRAVNEAIAKRRAAGLS